MSSEDTSNSSPKIAHDADSDKLQDDTKNDVPSAAVIQSETTTVVDEKTSTGTVTSTVDATVVEASAPSSHPLVSEDPDVPPGEILSKDANDDGSDDDFEADLAEMNWKPRGRTTYPTMSAPPPPPPRR